MAGFFRALGRIFNFAKVATGNILFALFLIVVLAFLFSPSESVSVPDRAALVLDLQGVVVEKPSIRDPLSLLTSGPGAPEIALTELLKAIETAAEDDRIGSVVLKTDQLAGVDATQLASIGAALDTFQAADKPVWAYGSFFLKNQYWLASNADGVFMHPMGAVLLEGYGVYQPYIAELLQRLKVDVNIFRVGTYKAAVEPLLRSDMSPEAKEANRVLVEALWSQYVDAVAANRKLGAAEIDAYAQNIAELPSQVSNDLALVAVESKLIDELMTPDEFDARMADGVGTDDESGFSQISLGDYLAATRKPELPSSEPSVAVIRATGTIMEGSDAPGTMGADSIVELIRTARDDDDVKAVVIRIDSPGGSALASELMRRELELVQIAGKPVVASYAGVSASGGYWMSATVDHIVASPATITGSIGIFNVVPSLNRAASDVGIQSDGVGTTPLAAVGGLLSPMSNAFASVLQASVESGYEQFIGLVARGRDMTPETVDPIAQGRIWIGSQAKELGLVDSLGDLNHAVEIAAELASLGDDFQRVEIKRELSPEEQFINNLVDQMGFVAKAETSLIARLQQLDTALAPLLPANGRPALLALCEACPVTR